MRGKEERPTVDWHVYGRDGDRDHIIDCGCDCWCEPKCVGSFTSETPKAFIRFIVHDTHLFHGHIVAKK